MTIHIDLNLKKLFSVVCLLAVAVMALAQTSSITVTDQATGVEAGTNVHNSTLHAQWMHIKYKDLDWGGSATGDVQAVGYSALIDCTSKNKLVIKAEGSASTTSITIRVWFFDHNATQVGTPTEAFSLVNTQIQEGTSNEALNASYYHFVAATMDVLPGAEQFKIQMVSVASGTGKVWGRGV
jgi:hypothetical protein